jgi:hypothetical protein
MEWHAAYHTDRPSAAELRRRARREPDRAAAARMQAIANALEGMTRAVAARLAGMPCLLARVNPDGPDVESTGLYAGTLPRAEGSLGSVGNPGLS